MPIDTNLARDPSAAHWERRARLLAAEINAGWWLSSWLPTALVIGIAGTFALLWARWQAVELVPFAWGAIGVALVVAGVAAWFTSRPRFESVASARVLLEERLGLHARLSSAAAGVGDWPGRRIDLAAGELLDVVDAEHAVDESAYVGPQAGGSIAPAANGGGPSRVDNLLPREQDAVRRFFK